MESIQVNFNVEVTSLFLKEEKLKILFFMRLQERKESV